MKTKCIVCLHVVSIPSRFRIFEFLKNNTQGVSISQLVKLSKLRQPTVTFHVKQLVESGLVRTKKHGREVLCEAHKRCDSCPLFA